MTPTRTAALLLALCLGSTPMITASSVTGAMSRCLTPTGAMLFTQFGCPPGSIPTDPADRNGVLSVVATPELTSTERDMRDMIGALEAELARQRKVRQRDQASRALARDKARHEAEARCAEATRKLDAITISRRKGYTAAEGRRLDEEEKHWRGVRHARC